MLCQKCKKNNATFFYTQTINGNSYSVALCDECKKLHISKEEQENFSQLYYNFLEENIFGSSLFPDPLLMMGKPSSLFSLQKEQKRCSACGAAFSELCNGRAFCPECYFTFGEELGESLKNMHGASLHKGRRPSSRAQRETATLTKEENAESKNVNQEPEKTKIGFLKEKLQQAIKEERYEDAAKIRDEIKEMESKEKGE